MCNYSFLSALHIATRTIHCTSFLMEVASSSSPPKYPLLHIKKWPLFLLRFTGYLSHHTKEGLLQDPFSIRNPHLYWACMVAAILASRSIFYNINFNDFLRLTGRTLATDYFIQAISSFAFTVLELLFIFFPIVKHKQVAKYWKDNANFVCARKKSS